MINRGYYLFQNKMLVKYHVELNWTNQFPMYQQVCTTSCHKFYYMLTNSYLQGYHLQPPQGHTNKAVLIKAI